MSLVPYSLGELFGPVKCEHDRCEALSWVIWMAQEEYALAKSKEYPTNFVFENKIGIAFCEEHQPNFEKPLLCSCGGSVVYFGEALMGSLTCGSCGEYIAGVGRSFIGGIKDRWTNGERGWVKGDYEND